MLSARYSSQFSFFYRIKDLVFHETFLLSVISLIREKKKIIDTKKTRSMPSRERRFAFVDSSTIQVIIRIFVEIAVIRPFAIQRAGRSARDASPQNTCKRNKTDDVFRRGADASAAFSFPPPFFFFFII
ncbi:hypothetical protein P5V15_009581 [Pogonomyrmex californicus]